MIRSVAPHLQVLAFTQNRRTMLSWREDRVRLHQAFARASDDVLRAVGLYCSLPHLGSARARQTVKRFIRRIGQPERRPASPRPADPDPSGDARNGTRRVDGRTEAEALAIVARVAPHIHRVVYTRNRRTMASVPRGGPVLRLHEAFAAAPDDVLVAVARLFTARDRRTRTRARQAVGAFIRTLPPAPVQRRPRVRVHEPGDAPIIARLQAEFDRTNDAHFGGELPRVPLFLSGAMRRRNGHFSRRPLEIVISRRLCTHAQPGQAEETLRHEMIHLWQHATGKTPDHGREFRAWARRLDVHPRATRPVAWKDR